MTVTLCESCHHRPSMRDGDPAYCYCGCHDVADQSPMLFDALEYAYEQHRSLLPNPNECGCTFCLKTRAALGQNEVAEGPPFDAATATGMYDGW